MSGAHPMAIPRIVDQPATDNLCTSRGRLSDDLLKGAKEIAEFLLGDSKQRRQIYHLAQHGRLPVFKIGATICARRSTLLTWIEEQESHGSDDHPAG